MVLSSPGICHQGCCCVRGHQHCDLDDSSFPQRDSSSYADLNIHGSLPLPPVSIAWHNPHEHLGDPTAMLGNMMTLLPSGRQQMHELYPERRMLQQFPAYEHGEAVGSPLTNSSSGAMSMSPQDVDDLSGPTSPFISAASFAGAALPSASFQSAISCESISTGGLTVRPDVSFHHNASPPFPSSPNSVSMISSHSDEDCDVSMSDAEGSPSPTTDEPDCSSPPPERVDVRGARREYLLLPKEPVVPHDVAQRIPLSTHQQEVAKREIARAPRPLRSHPDRVACSICDKKFRGPPELDRHIEHLHKRSMVWKCVNDPSKPRFYLPDGCKACEEGKEYARVDNAASHMRRVHCNPKDPGKGNQNRGGKSGGSDPPLHVLKAEGVVLEVQAGSSSMRSGADNDTTVARPRQVRHSIGSSINHNIPSSGARAADESSRTGRPTAAALAYEDDRGPGYLPRHLKESCPRPIAPSFELQNGQSAHHASNTALGGHRRRSNH